MTDLTSYLLSRPIPLASRRLPFSGTENFNRNNNCSNNWILENVGKLLFLGGCLSFSFVLEDYLGPLALYIGTCTTLAFEFLSTSYELNQKNALTNNENEENEINPNIIKSCFICVVKFITTFGIAKYLDSKFETLPRLALSCLLVVTGVFLNKYFDHYREQKPLESSNFGFDSDNELNSNTI